MIGRVLRAGLLLVLMAGIGVAAAVVWRTELAEAAARRWLVDAGFPAASLSVTALGWNQAVVEAVSLGPDAPRAERVVFDYELAALWGGRLAAVEVRGLRVPVDLGARRPLPWLPDASNGGEASPAAAPAAIPPLPVGAVRIRDARLALTADGRPGRVDFDAHLNDADGSPRLTMEGVARASGLDLRFRAQVAEITAEPRLEITVDGTASASGLPWPAKLPGAPQAGRVAVHGEYRGGLPDRLSVAGGLAVLSRAELELEATLTAWRMRDLGAAVSGRLALRSDPGTGGLDLRTLEPLVLDGSPPADVWRALGLGDAAAALAGIERLTLQGPAGEGGGPLATLRPAEDAWRIGWQASLQAEHAAGDVRAAGTGMLGLGRGGGLEAVGVESMELETDGLSLGPHRLGRLRVTGAGQWTEAALSAEAGLQGQLSRLVLPEAVTLGAEFELALSGETSGDAEASRVSLREPGQLTLTALPETPGLRVSAPLEVELLSGEASLREGVWTGRLRLAPADVTGLFAAGGDGGQPFRLLPGVLELVAHHGDATALRLIAGDAALQLPEQSLALRAVALDVARAPAGRLSGSVRLGRIVHEVPEPAFAPLRVSAEVSGGPEVLRLAGDVGPVAHDARIPLRLAHDAVAGNGELELGPGSVAFRPGGLTPADLVPRLGILEDATGELRLEGGLAWGEGGPQSRMTVALEMAEFRAAGVQVEGLETALALTSLLPLRSAPEQRLSIRELRAGVPVTDVQARFRLLQPETGPGGLALDLAGLEAAFAGGAVRVADTRFRLGQPEHRVTVEVRDVALEQLLVALGLGEDVRGEGRLSGAIPIRLGEQGVVIADGELRAGEPGRLQVRLRGTGEALARQAREMELMIRALEDFRYTVLAAELERDADGELRMSLQLEGSNPDVLEGHPFRFNITLSGNLDPVFRALRLGGDIGADFLREHLRLQ